MKCPNCHNIIDDNLNFCPICGFKLYNHNNDNSSDQFDPFSNNTGSRFNCHLRNSYKSKQLLNFSKSDDLMVTTIVSNQGIIVDYHDGTSEHFALSDCLTNNRFILSQIIMFVMMILVMVFVVITSTGFNFAYFSKYFALVFIVLIVTFATTLMKKPLNSVTINRNGRRLYLVFSSSQDKKAFLDAVETSKKNRY